MSAELSAGVTYRDHTGHLKAAIVIGTPESVNPKAPSEDELATLAKYGHGIPHSTLPALAEGSVRLLVLSPGSGRTSVRVAEQGEDGIFTRAQLAVSPTVLASPGSDEDEFDAEDEDNLPPLG
jgi:hypothetical protein